MENLEIKVFTKLDHEVKNQIDYLDTLCFPQEHLTEDQKALNHDRFNSKNNLFAYVIASLGAQLVGNIWLFKRQINFQGKKILLGGVGSVATNPAYQRTGIATQMLYVAMDELKKEKCDIAYLCTDISKLGKLYGKFGFVPLNREYTYSGLSGKKYVAKDSMIAPLNSEEIYQEVLEDDKPFDLQGTNW